MKEFSDGKYAISAKAKRNIKWYDVIKVNSTKIFVYSVYDNVQCYFHVISKWFCIGFENRTHNKNTKIFQLK